MQVSFTFIVTSVIILHTSESAFNLDWIDNWFRSSRSSVASLNSATVSLTPSSSSSSSLSTLPLVSSETNEPDNYCPFASSTLLIPFCTCEGPSKFASIKCTHVPSVVTLQRLLTVPSGSFGKLYISNSSIASLTSVRNLTRDEATFTMITFTKTNTKSIDLNVLQASRFTLKRLEITYNHLESFAFDSLQRFKKLSHLDLYYNNIKSIPDNAFGHNDHLVAIDLSYNKISYIGSNAFYELNSLESLDLRYNKLKVINNNAFAVRTSNRRLILDLSYNKIFYLADNCFKGQSARHLALDYNSLAKLSEKHFKPILAQLVTQTEGIISVKGNRFECNCQDSLWLYLLPENEKNRISDFTCVNSDKGTNLTNLNLSDLQCA